MRTDEIRSSYLAHFEGRGHRVISSAPLVPSDDPTILFTVAGMVPFKDALTGLETLPYKRATSCQMCIRAGGKHNDLENVGYTNRHHTFFEMLGNFSFGDYFKEGAIDWAWEYCKNILELDRDRLWFTVHPTDNEAREIWIKKVGIDPTRIIDIEENFWTMGDTGPCGPCSEIFYDQGDAVQGGPPGSTDEDGDRFIEIWNLVFPQFDKQPDGSLEPLASPGVDTGAGLERLASVMQGVHSNYETDVFSSVFKHLAELLKEQDSEKVIKNPSCRVIADHIRACAFLIADGVLPDREGRGYVLRRIIRRALRHGHKLAISEPFFHQLVKPLESSMGDAYPSLTRNLERISRSLHDEEQRFGETLRRGMEILDTAVKSAKDAKLEGDVVFQLYDTYGFPVDLTADICRERGVVLDLDRFEVLMGEQQVRARNSGQFKTAIPSNIGVQGTVKFNGYDRLVGEGQVTQLFKQEADQLIKTECLEKGDDGVVVLNETTFYGEAGGQIGDIGSIVCDSSTFAVRDVTRLNEQFLHHGSVTNGLIEIGSVVQYAVDEEFRQDVARNHSATHLLHAALKNELGSHVQQRGSLVGQKRFRFDFSHDEPMSDDARQRVEDAVNAIVLTNAPVETEILGFDEAIKKGAVALFGEKYDDDVRVLSMGSDYSMELCGGTHVSRLGEIGLFKITSESGIAAGVRRIEAVTGRAAHALFRSNEQRLNDIANQLGTTKDRLPNRIDQLLEQRTSLEQELKEARTSKTNDIVAELIAQSIQIENTAIVVHHMTDGNSKSMMTSFDDLRSRLNSHVVVLALIENERCQLVCGVSPDIHSKLGAGDVIKQLATKIDIRGGGKPQMARGGGNVDMQSLDDALSSLPGWIQERLKS